MTSSAPTGAAPAASIAVMAGLPQNPDIAAHMTAHARKLGDESLKTTNNCYYLFLIN